MHILGQVRGLCQHGIELQVDRLLEGPQSRGQPRRPSDEASEVAAAQSLPLYKLLPAAQTFTKRTGLEPSKKQKTINAFAVCQ